MNNLVNIEMIFDTYIAQLVLTHHISTEVALAHCLNRGVIAMCLVGYDESAPQLEIVLPRLQNSRRAIELINGFMFEGQSGTIELTEDSVIFKG